MVVFKALKAQERDRILQSLNRQQLKVYWGSIAYRVSDKLLTNVYRGSASWRLFAINIDYEWDLRKVGQHCGQPLKCLCKRTLRYQYELESLENNEHHVFLGATHFAEHLGIPASVAKEIKAQMNQVQSLMDEILIKYRMGQGFPKRFVAGIKDGTLSFQSPAFVERVVVAMEADMPITGVMERRLDRIFLDPSTNITSKSQSESLTRQERIDLAVEAAAKRKAESDRRDQLEQASLDAMVANQRQQRQRELELAKGAQLAGEPTKKLSKNQAKKARRLARQLAAEKNSEVVGEQESLKEKNSTPARHEQHMTTDKPRKRPASAKPPMNRQLFDQLKAWQQQNN